MESIQQVEAVGNMIEGVFGNLISRANVLEANSDFGTLDSCQEAIQAGGNLLVAVTSSQLTLGLSRKKLSSIKTGGDTALSRAVRRVITDLDTHRDELSSIAYSVNEFCRLSRSMFSYHEKSAEMDRRADVESV